MYPAHRNGHFGGNTLACLNLPTVDILNFIHKGQQQFGYQQFVSQS